MIKRLIVLGRVGLVGIAATAAWRLVWRVCAAPCTELARAVVDRSAPTAGWTLERWVRDAAALGVALAFSGLVLAVALTLAREGVVRHRPALAPTLPTIAPALVRRAVLAACGLGLAGPLLTAPLGASATTTCQATCPGPVTGLRLPDLPASSRHTCAPIVVQPGATLWSIAEQRAPRAGVPAIAADVDRLYTANRERIGPDPDLIYPGTHLTTCGDHHDADA